MDLGVSFNPAPCTPTFLTGGIVSPTCSAYYNYSNYARTRINSPTEQVSLQSNFFPSVQFTGKYSYTGGNMGNSQDQLGFVGRESRTNLYDYSQGGPIMGRHISSYADFGAIFFQT